MNTAINSGAKGLTSVWILIISWVFCLLVQRDSGCSKKMSPSLGNSISPILEDLSCGAFNNLVGSTSLITEVNQHLDRSVFPFKSISGEVIFLALIHVFVMCWIYNFKKLRPFLFWYVQQAKLTLSKYLVCLKVVERF